MADYGEYDSTLYKNQSDNTEQVKAGLDYIKNRYGVNTVIPSASDRVASSTYTQPQQITKRVLRTVETYDEAGRVISKETIEETTYGQSGIVYPSWYQNPVISHTNGLDLHDSTTI